MENFKQKQIQTIDINQLYVSEKNVRKDLNTEGQESNLITLSENIKEHGLISPLCVRKQDNGFEIFAGQRRFLAIKLLNWKDIPCIVYSQETTDEEIYDISFAENTQRNDMTQKDKIIYYSNLYRQLGRIEEVAKRTNLSESTIKFYLRLNSNLSKEIIDQLDSNDINLKLIGTISQIKKEEQNTIFQEIKKLESTKEKMERLSKIVDLAKRRKRKNEPSFGNKIITDLNNIDSPISKIINKPWVYDRNKNILEIPENLWDEIADMVNDYKYDNFLD
jgi:ParB family chromosome partitioning protein